MKFLQVALLFTFVIVLTNVDAQRSPLATYCVSNRDCYQQHVDCFCIGKGLYNPGRCECTGLNPGQSHLRSRSG